MFRDPGLDIMGAFKALEFQRAQNVNLVKLLKKKIGLLEKEGKHFQETVKMYQSENERLREKIHLLQSQQLQLPYHIQPSPMVLDRHNNSSMSILGGKKSSLSGQGVNPVSSGHLFLKDSVTSPRVTRRGIRNMISSPPQIPNMLVNHCPPNLEQNGQTLASEANNPTFGGMKINAFETPQAFKRSGKQPSMSLLQKMSGWISK